MKRISIILVALLLGLAAPPLATAQFGPQNVPAPLTQPDDTAATQFEEDNGLSTRQLVLIFGGAIAIIAFIAWFIMRDAHRAAPATERHRAGASGTAKSPSAKSAREREREKARKRNKAKAARNQRRRNRQH